MRMTVGHIAFAWAVLLTPPCASAQPPVGSLHEDVLLRADGSADIRATLEWPAGVQDLSLPIAGEAPTAVVVRRASGGTVAAEWNPGRHQLDLTIDTPASQPWSLEVGYAQKDVAAQNASGDLSLHRQFMNTTDSGIERYSMTVVLPEAFVFRDVDSTDADDRSGTAALGAYDGRHALTIESRLAARGGRVRLDAGAHRRGNPRPLMLVLAALGAAYLYWFRDLIERREA